MSIQPTQFLCPDHPTIDLTELVKDKVENDPTVVTNYGFSDIRPRPTHPMPFDVIVQCPGPSADGSGAHDTEFGGTFTP